MPEGPPANDARSALRLIDKRLAELWSMGSWFIAGWTLHGNDLIVAIAPTVYLPQLAAGEVALMRGDQMDARALVTVAQRAQLRIESIPAGPWWKSPQTYAALTQSVQRYAIRRSPFHATARVEMDGFDSLSTAEQIAQFATLSYSINLAANRMVAAGIEIDLGRAASSSGYWLWNRRQGWKADVDLFCLMALALAENGLARERDARTSPVIKAAFTVEAGWEFSLPRGGGSPMIHNDVLGEVRGTVARLIDVALPGQILLGRFDRPMVEGPPKLGVIYKNLEATRFMALAQRRMSEFDNVVLGVEKAVSVKLYLTGDEIAVGAFDIKAFQFPLSAEKLMEAFNVKLNIHRPEQAPFFYGLQHKDLKTQAPARAYISTDAPLEFVLKE